MTMGETTERMWEQQTFMKMQARASPAARRPGCGAPAIPRGEIRLQQT